MKESERKYMNVHGWMFLYTHKVHYRLNYSAVLTKLQTYAFRPLAYLMETFFYDPLSTFLIFFYVMEKIIKKPTDFTPCQL